MSETRDDLREALADRLWRRFPISKWQAEAHADALIKDTLAPILAPILAQVSALQAEVEALKRTLNEAIVEVDPPLTDGVWSGSLAEAIRAERTASQALAERARAEVERLQKGLNLAADEATSHRNAAVAALRERDAALERLQKIEGERDAAVTALRPFAAMAAQYDGYGDAYQPLTCRPSVGMLRSARSSVTETKEGSDAR